MLLSRHLPVSLRSSCDDDEEEDHDAMTMKMMVMMMLMRARARATVVMTMLTAGLDDNAIASLCATCFQHVLTFVPWLPV